MNDRTRLLVLQLAVIAGVCAFLFFFGLGAFGLVGADEPRYAQIAHEMLLRHDWIIPTFNGAPWLEKPVLLYWTIINTYRIFGVHDWAGRFPSAAHAALLVVVVFFFMRKFRRGSELDAALITASSAWLIGLARGATTDMPLAVHFSIAMLAWWTWHETEKRAWLAASYAFLAFGALAKGPVAPVLAFLVVVSYTVLRREGKVLARTLWWPGLLLFAAIALPWYVAIQMRVPQFFHVFFIEHNFERFGTNLYRHAQPFWYYIPVFLVSTLPWTTFSVSALFEAIAAAVRRLRAGESASSGRTDDPLSSFLMLWTVVPLVFFSISRSKLPGYILPAVPAVAMLASDYLHRRERIARWQLMLHSLVCGGILGGALWTPWFMRKEPVNEAARIAIVLGAGVIAVLVIVMVRRTGLRALHFATLLPVVLALAFLLRPAAPVINQVYSARAIDFRLRELGVEKQPLAVFDVKHDRDIAYGLNFYRNQPVTYYAEGPRDLPHGVPAEEHVVVTKAGNGDAVRAVVGEREVKPLGGFTPQHLEFFLVSTAR